MATVIAPPEERIAEQSEQRLLLGAVEWDTYQAISKALTGRHVRLTYDRGTLEFMTISSTHGNLRWLLGRLVWALAEEFGLPLRGFGDMTCDRQDLERGVEPDECFYLVNEPQIRNREAIDLTRDPPPDLMLEIDVSRSSRRRIEICAAMGVPEVWQLGGETIRVHQLGPAGQYVLTAESRYFPGIRVAELITFVNRRTEMDEMSLVRAFREWVRQLITANPPPK